MDCLPRHLPIVVNHLQAERLTRVFGRGRAVTRSLSPFTLTALWCWYRGAGFRGYQQQEGHRTVQGEVLRAFAEAGLPRNPVVAGRTDRGVSARMQVLSMRVPRGLTTDEVRDRLSPRLPADLGVHLVKEVDYGCHAAFSANAKEYRYTLAEPGDVAVLKEAAALVPGTRDFRVFHFKSSDVRPRTVTSVEVLPSEGAVVLRFRGEGFARYMVRMLVGGLHAVSTGQVSMEMFREGLERQQAFHCPTAPAEPLTLWDVGYPVEVDPFSREERESFAWPVSS